MAIASWTETYMECPHCTEAIILGTGRRFGPGKVICYNCKKEFDTGFTDIYEIPKLQKNIVIMTELFFPSYFSGIDQPGKFFGILLHLFFVIFMPIVMLLVAIPEFIKAESQLILADGAFLLIMMGIFPLYHIFGLWRMVRESKKFHDTGEAPIWRTPRRARKAKGFSFKRVLLITIFIIIVGAIAIPFMIP